MNMLHYIIYLFTILFHFGKSLKGYIRKYNYKDVIRGLSLRNDNNIQNVK